MGHARQNLLKIAVAIAIMAVALWFRLVNLSGPPLWLDEGYSAYGAEKSFDFIFHVLPGYETHPPFYTALLRVWTLITGTSILGFRSLGAVAGLLSLPIYWLGGKEAARATGRDPSWTALTVLAIAAVLPSLVEWTHGVRPYPVIMMVFAAGIWAVLRIARGLREDGGIPAWPWCLYLVCQALLFWLHNLGALYVAALGLGLLILCGPGVFFKSYRTRFLIGHALVLLVALPAFAILLDQAPMWRQATWLRFNPANVPNQMLAIYGMTLINGIMFAPILVVLAFRNGMRTQAALLTMSLFPVLISLALSYTVTPVFLPRTLVAVSVPMIILLGLGAASGTRVAAVVAILFIGQSTLAEIAIRKSAPQQDWYGAVNWLIPRVRPGDRIYAYPNEGALPLHYALREKRLAIPVRPIPEAVPSHDPTGWYPTGSRGVVSLPQYRLNQIAADDQSNASPTIWLIRLGPGTYDRGDGFVKALLRNREIIAVWPPRKPGQPRGEPLDIIGLRLSPQSAPSEEAKP